MFGLGGLGEIGIQKLEGSGWSGPGEGRADTLVIRPRPSGSVGFGRRGLMDWSELVSGSLIFFFLEKLYVWLLQK